MKIYYLIFLALVPGCSMPPVIYNPEGLNISKLVTVTTVQENKLYDSGYSAVITRVWNESNEEITNSHAYLDGFTRNVTLREGKYKFRVECSNGIGIARPEASFYLVSGKNYLIYCVIEKKKNFLGILVEDYAAINIKEI